MNIVPHEEGNRDPRCPDPVTCCLVHPIRGRRRSRMRMILRYSCIIHGTLTHPRKQTFLFILLQSKQIPFMSVAAGVAAQ